MLRVIYKKNLGLQDFSLILCVLGIKTALFRAGIYFVVQRGLALFIILVQRTLGVARFCVCLFGFLFVFLIRVICALGN